jgi:hypothetical protein
MIRNKFVLVMTDQGGRYGRSRTVQPVEVKEYVRVTVYLPRCTKKQYLGCEPFLTDAALDAMAEGERKEVIIWRRFVELRLKPIQRTLARVGWFKRKGQLRAGIGLARSSLTSRVTNVMDTDADVMMRASDRKVERDEALDLDEFGVCDWKAEHADALDLDEFDVCGDTVWYREKYSHRLLPAYVSVQRFARRFCMYKLRKNLPRWSSRGVEVARQEGPRSGTFLVCPIRRNFGGKV